MQEENDNDILEINDYKRAIELNFSNCDALKDAAEKSKLTLAECDKINSKWKKLSVIIRILIIPIFISAVVEGIRFINFLDSTPADAYRSLKQIMAVFSIIVIYASPFIIALVIFLIVKAGSMRFRRIYKFFKKKNKTVNYNNIVVMFKQRNV